MPRPVRAAAPAAVLLTLALAAPVAAPRAARAQAAPTPKAQSADRFAGRWVLDTARSTRGPGVPPALTMHVRLDGPKLVVRRVAETPAGPLDVSLTYATDGTASVNRFQQGGAELQATTTTGWDGATLTFDTQIQTPAQPVQQKDRWTVSPDGRDLTVERALSAGGQELTMTLVLRKQPG
jgi:hypothetical protein